jgi:hypothetical protein
MKLKHCFPSPGDAARSGLLAAMLAGSLLALGGCNRQEDPADTAKDMGEARQEGTENVREAAEEAAENRADGASLKEATSDAYKVEAEKIHADYEVAKERCDGVAEADKAQCRKDAESAHEAAMKALDAKRDSMTGDESPTSTPTSPATTPMGPP